MYKYKFEIEFENNFGGRSYEIFICKSVNEEEARKELGIFLLETGKFGSKIKLIK